MRAWLKQIEKDFINDGMDKVNKSLDKNFGITLLSTYLDFELKSPIIVAPGPLSQTTSQIVRAATSGFGGMVLKSVVGEDKYGNSSMKMLRTKPTFARWVSDDEGNPVYHWNGGLDQRTFTEYLKFAEKSFKIGEELKFAIIPSFLCHLPKDIEKEDWKVEEWEYTVTKLSEAALPLYKDRKITFEIDFCPFLKREKLAVDKKTILHWYRETPKLVKENCPNSYVVPKIMNLDFGLDFQIEMIKAAKQGGADCVVIANRFFRKFVDPDTKESYFTAHGGRELRIINQGQIAKAKEAVNIPISATGGTYSGKHVYEYLSLGAQNVQLVTYVMKYGFEESFKNIMFNMQDGLLAALVMSKMEESK
ncbi:hypothetical protein KEJ33_03840 [Candidatus Bathyarchaeota archaeon]|nr:hypothetical protein [Candidatus Bathyarchaeota archaeon]